MLKLLFYWQISKLYQMVGWVYYNDVGHFCIPFCPIEFAYIAKLVWQLVCWSCFNCKSRLSLISCCLFEGFFTSIFGRSLLNTLSCNRGPRQLGKSLIFEKIFNNL
jgi:hypothetical protein